MKRKLNIFIKQAYLNNTGFNQGLGCYSYLTSNYPIRYFDLNHLKHQLLSIQFLNYNRRYGSELMIKSLTDHDRDRFYTANTTSGISVVNNCFKIYDNSCEEYIYCAGEIYELPKEAVPSVFGISL